MFKAKHVVTAMICALIVGLFSGFSIGTSKAYRLNFQSPSDVVELRRLPHQIGNCMVIHTSESNFLETYAVADLEGHIIQLSGSESGALMLMNHLYRLRSLDCYDLKE